jgi:hypothetical protein
LTVTAFCNWVSRLVVAACRAVILPLSAIEPVLSSTSATRNRLDPHLVVDEPVTVMVLYPMMPRRLVGTSARDDGDSQHGSHVPLPVFPETGEQHETTPL